MRANCQLQTLPRPIKTIMPHLLTLPQTVKLGLMFQKDMCHLCLRTHQYVPKLTNVTVSSTVTVPAMSEMVITATLDVPLKGLVPHDYAGVFEPHYTDHSATGFAWTIAKAEQGSIYVSKPLQ